MEFYSSEPEIVQFNDPEPFDCDFLKAERIEVTEGRKIGTIANSAGKILKKGSVVCIQGVGSESLRAVQCVEIIKHTFKTLHQITVVNQTRTVETYAPLIQGLDSLEVRRSVPVIHILLSTNSVLSERTPGYQLQKRGKVSKKMLVSEWKKLSEDVLESK